MESHAIELQQGLTALMMAAKEGHADCLIELIAHGADVDLQDDVSHTCGMSNTGLLSC